MNYPSVFFSRSLFVGDPLGILLQNRAGNVLKGEVWYMFEKGKEQFSHVFVVTQRNIINGYVSVTFGRRENLKKGVWEEMRDLEVVCSVSCFQNNWTRSSSKSVFFSFLTNFFRYLEVDRDLDLDRLRDRLLSFRSDDLLLDLDRSLDRSRERDLLLESSLDLLLDRESFDRERDLLGEGDRDLCLFRSRDLLRDRSLPESCFTRISATSPSCDLNRELSSFLTAYFMSDSRRNSTTPVPSLYTSA